MLQKELQANRVEGPFTHPPFHNYICSPIGLRAKKEKGKFRMIHDLSSPQNNSVNSKIPDQQATVQYQTLDHVIGILQDNGPGSFMAKADIQEAFRIIPIAPSCYHLLGFQFQGHYYYDKVLPMGLRSSCAIFEKFSTALHWILQPKFGARGVSHILDDFIFISANKSTCFTDLNNFLHMCQEIQVPIKQEKTVTPQTQLEAHGILLDSVQWQAKLPTEKLQKCTHLLKTFSHKHKTTLQQLQSLIGTLQFACKVISPGRAFLRRLINLTLGVTKQHHHIHISAEAHQDIKCWLQFLQCYNGVSVFINSKWLSSSTINLYADAAGSKGFAIVYGKRWLAGPFPNSWQHLHITIKELYPIVLALAIWGPQLHNNKILFHTDNLACMHIINTQTSKGKNVMILVRHLVLTALTNNILFKATHVPGKINTIPDLLSRFQLQKARKLAPWLDPNPTPIPSHLMPEHMIQVPRQLTSSSAPWPPQPVRDITGPSKHTLNMPNHSP